MHEFGFLGLFYGVDFVERISFLPAIIIVKPYTFTFIYIYISQPILSKKTVVFFY